MEPPEHLGNLHLPVGKIRNLSRRLPCQTRIPLVRFMDHALQSLRRRPALLPPRGVIALFISKHQRTPRPPETLGTPP